VWKLPIPLYTSADPAHERPSALGHQEAQLVADLDLDEKGNFVTIRQNVREALAAGSVLRK
jgi:hypothetical protein